MFELYSVPSLTYCVDGIMSFYQNNLPAPTDPFTANGLVISFNTASTSVIPILRGKGVLSLAKRYGMNSVLLGSGLIGVQQNTMGRVADVRIPPQTYTTEIPQLPNTRHECTN